MSYEMRSYITVSCSVTQLLEALSIPRVDFISSNSKTWMKQPVTESDWLVIALAILSTLQQFFFQKRTRDGFVFSSSFTTKKTDAHKINVRS